MNINCVNEGINKATKRTRVGRGTGSGLGKTCGRGHKGQGSRSGWSMPALFEGGQMPLVRRIPKRGFNNRAFAEVVVSVNIGDIELLFQAGETVSPETLMATGLVKTLFDEIKILGDGELTKKLTFRAHRFSATAKSKIEAAGGTVEILPGKKPVVKNKMGSRKAAAVAKATVSKSKTKK
ncbi:MAG: 50S ribosomal protein L15 [Thermoguttaceae bacterium]